MTTIKRPAQLLEALACVRARGVDADLLLVGDGPLLQGLKELAARTGIAAHTHFLGYRDDVGRLYAASDVVALTSANEGTPVSLIEALAASRPVVSTDVGGVSDVVVEGRSGFLVGPEDVEAFADRLVRLAGDPGLRRVMGETGRADVLDRYSVPRLVDDVDRLYRDLLLPGRQGEAAPRSVSRAAWSCRGPTRAAAPRDPGLAVLPTRDRSHPDANTELRPVPRRSRPHGHRHLRVPEPPPRDLAGLLPRPPVRGRPFERLPSPSRLGQGRSKKAQRTRMAFYLSFMGLATAVAPLAGRADVVLATTPPLSPGSLASRSPG